MNAIGWQIGACLIGISALITAIYIAKLLSSASQTIEQANKVVEKAYRILDRKERDIEDIISNAASITGNVDTIIEAVTKIGSIVNVFRFVKRKKKRKSK